ncbi:MULTISPECIES: metal-dependent hydrolase family protein [unclassified Sphingomonas]|uniref:metal-dependent hydrolase family protein n=1 Tax=unclassified Sphingomonas TaxID=196159 RepID=UPI0006F75FB8|nr:MULTISPECIES: amidohydrolase family protein [unclassified Sphingomonas]KQX22657.1 hypothetical protein ASD17_05015 [Sphingomonas sp. Root1294]KQY67864.1 hypothetical protein ASD39_08115 [Sphingomonas sp. Root50]KRB88788.1 hypothetical protein ASE22_20460 [Sphingomonas sp. Root720]
MITILANAQIFDGLSEDLVEGHIIVEGDFIRDVTRSQPAITDARIVECGGRYLIPGLIDAHFHTYTPSFDILRNDAMPPSLLTSHGIKILSGALHRGFTTVRDAAGGDIGLRTAIDQKVIEGPRFFFSGKAISQTGGHGDPRPGDRFSPCGCAAGYDGSMSLVADGPDEVRKAVREELRKGATQIKLMLSGGVISPTDPMWMQQFTDEEVLAAVHEAATRRTYVMAHAHTDDAIRRCAELGIRTVEHGTEIFEDTARLLAEKGTYVVPTLAVGKVLYDHGPRLGMPPLALEKIRGVADQTAQSIGNCIAAGVKLGLGSDLLSHEFHGYQGAELALRGQYQPAIDVLRSATTINAEILQMTGKLGCIAPGAFADILVLEKNPLEDLAVFQAAEQFALIMKGGDIVSTSLKV